MQFYNLLVKNTDNFEILSTLLGVYIIMRGKSNNLSLVMSAIIISFSIYCNPNHLIFIGTVFIIIRKYNANHIY